MFSDDNVATCWNRYRMNYIFASINTIAVYLLGSVVQRNKNIITPLNLQVTGCGLIF